MILYIQIILICVLILILASLYLDERYKQKNKIPKGKLTQFWDGTERRRFVRISANVPVRYSLPKGGDNLKVVKTKDISIGGICMTITEKLSPNIGLRLEIELGEATSPIFAKGEVVWVKEDADLKDKEGIRYFSVGVEFREILPKDRERLVGFIKRSEQIQGGRD